MSTDTPENPETSSSISDQSESRMLEKDIKRILQDNGLTYAEDLPDHLEREYLMPVGAEYSSVQDYVDEMENVRFMDNAPCGKAYYLTDE